MKGIVGLLLVLAVLIIIPALDLAFAAGAEPGEYVDRRVIIWNLFFRMMTVAFTVGAVVAGTMIWLVWRFRESHPKAKPTAYEGTDW
ncbi:heme transporter CcmC [Marine Group I thaumarchaeote]|jgi:heme/copper-type cytochrome/quinol oxidase subunit 2|uniref:Heme transporter CcmC n=1 Tax=Marine Group I thaumarchaeote TaxID=2511932 RepID=A0A7K4P2J2_9ARCH|nr:MAG: heme transporter CcmC [Nitrosopumilus sp. YT1]MCH2404697.1 heme transporter CcmC [Nitrosopumilus sp.]NMI81926.1 heme transporter CcmC [Candidatus Nitrosopumilus sp. MTA1]NWJ19869.1 heme transporter CcmC [Marine Group I thaumarchaeote]NWJ57616.1 heme transporter CcmC [Marine Group I thaumarchaeote]